MLEQLDDYSWREAFGYAGKEQGTFATYQGIEPVKVVQFAAPVSTEPFDREDVAEIIAMSDGENDGPNWIGIFKLKDGRYASIDAGCDYTGWDCQACGYAEVCGTLEEMIKWGLSDEQRKRLGLSVDKHGEA
ncbi:hypothetical protein SAMN05216312_102183 [Cohnella sp. OV330]|uniref:hypothetical protein n=1 Tax=Cohnella sp. OV330 TaxID=1855288 RepID=UPI0008EC0164|nr:hypothetical protein [Cohnella sp. OV330]SFA91025.1 hypothetical protein SAMN05216312_102183 [Cohnella sp. OV330]